MVELLVVTAILIVLAALVFSVTGSMMKAAKASTCSNNLRQISPILHSIREEGVDTGQTPPGCFPPYAGQISTPSPWRRFTIYELLGEQAGFCVFDQGDYRWTTHPSETLLQNPLSEHTLASEVDKPSEITHDTLGSMGGYGYNHLIEEWVSINTDPAKVRSTRIFDVKYPELTIIMGEQNHNLEKNGIWMGPYNGRTPAGTYKASAHCLFVDGHVELLKNDYLDSQKGRDKHFNPDKVVF